MLVAVFASLTLDWSARKLEVLSKLLPLNVNNAVTVTPTTVMKIRAKIRVAPLSSFPVVLCISSLGSQNCLTFDVVNGLLDTVCPKASVTLPLMANEATEATTVPAVPDPPFVPRVIVML